MGQGSDGAVSGVGGSVVHSEMEWAGVESVTKWRVRRRESVSGEETVRDGVLCGGMVCGVGDGMSGGETIIMM